MAMFGTKADADAWLSAQMTDVGRGAWVDLKAGTIAISGYAKQWVEHRPNLRPRARELYSYLLKRYIESELGDVALGRISPSQVRGWHAALAAQHPSTVAKAYRLLAAICGTAVADELIARTPCRVEGAGIERAPERPIATVVEVAALADAMPERFRVVVLFASWCGLRRGEVVALRRRDVDVLHGTVSVVRAMQQLHNGALDLGPPKSDAGRRTVAVPDNVLPDLVVHLDRYVGSDADSLLVTGAKGGVLRPHVLQSAWNRARLVIGRADLHLRDLRHTGNTWAASTGASTRELMARMGHADPSAALRHQYATADRDRAIADALAGLAERATVTDLDSVRSRGGHAGLGATSHASRDSS
jgi:integrase